jgi:hypothetical protein
MSPSVPFLRLFVLALGICALPAFAKEPQGVPPLKVVYFTPSDRMPDPNRQERLGRVMRNIQEFYRKGMEANGHGPKTFALEWDTPERLRLYEVRGKRKLTDYPKGTEWVVYDEVRETLKAKRIDIDKEYVLVLGGWIDWVGDVATEYGPYSGGGDAHRGFAFACDDKLIDADLLSSKEPGGYHYMIRDGYCSLGMYNTLYIGGIAHELGHAFGVPHDCQRDADKDTLGISLMGIGNHHYGKASRGEGADAFLTASSALRLSVCRAFDPGFAKYQQKPAQGSLENFDASFQDGKLILTGKCTGDMPRGIIVYNDNEYSWSDYDAKTRVTIPDKAGYFRFEIDELERVSSEMRLVAVFPGGGTDGFHVKYSNASGTPELEPFYSSFAGKTINACLDRREWRKTADILETMITKFPNNKTWAKKLKHLETVKIPPAFFEPDKVPADVKSTDLTYAEAMEAKVGWYEPSRGILRECGFFEVDGTFYDSGIYAHPKSLYVFSLGKQWKEFQFKYGIQDGKPGSVVFVVRADGREIFRSRTVRAREILFKKLDVTNVDKLELITEDAGDGWANDWGLWLEPQLSR